MSNVGYATLQIIPSAKGFGAALNGQTGPAMAASGRRGGVEASKGFSSSFLPGVKGLAGGFAAMWAGSKAVGFLKSAVGEASDLNEAGTALQQVFGTATPAIMNFAAGGAKALGMSRLAAMNAAQTFGVYGKAAGLAGKANADFASGMASLSTDLASFYNSSPEEAMQAIAAGLRGENEPLRRFGVLLDDATLRTEALKQGLIKTTSQALTPQQKVLAAHAVILRQTKVAQGDFQRTSGGLANQQRILSATMEDLKGKIGRALLPVVLGVTKAFVGLLNGGSRLRPIFHALGEAWSVFSEALKGHDVTALGFLGKIGSVAYALRDAFGTVIGVLDVFWGTLTGKGARTGFVDALSGPMLNSVIGFGASISRVVDVVRANFLPILAQVWRIITTNVVPVFQAVAGIILDKVWPAVLGVYQALARTLVPVLEALFRTIQANVLPALARVWERFQEWLPTIERVIGVVLTVVGAVLKFAFAILRVVLPPLVQFAGFLLGTVIRAVLAVIGVVFRIIGAVFDFAGALGHAIGAAASFAAGIGRFIGQAIGVIAGLPGRIIRAVGGLGSTLFGAGKDLLLGFIHGIESMAGELIGAIKRTVTDHLPGFVKKALGIHSPSRVFMALGAYTAEGFALGIESMIGRTQAAMGAAVAPPSAPDLPAQGGGLAGALAASTAGTPVTVPLYLDGRVVAETVFTVGGRDVAYGRKEF